MGLLRRLLLRWGILRFPEPHATVIVLLAQLDEGEGVSWERLRDAAAAHGICEHELELVMFGGRRRQVPRVARWSGKQCREILCLQGRWDTRPIMPRILSSSPRRVAPLLVLTLLLAGAPVGLIPTASALYAAGAESWEPASFATWQTSGATAASDCATTKGEGCTLKIAPQGPGIPVKVSKSFTGFEVGAAPWYISTYYRASTTSTYVYYTFNVTTDEGYFGVNFTGGPGHNEVFLFTQDEVTTPIATMSAGAWYHVNLTLDAVTLTMQARVQDSGGNNVGSSPTIRPPLREIRTSSSPAAGDGPSAPSSGEPAANHITSIAFSGLLTSAQGLLGNPAINFETLKLLVATPPIAPVASATGGPAVGEVTLSWSAPLDDGGATITNYSIYAGNTSGATTFLTNVTPPTRNFTERGLAPGTWRYYRVSAWNNAGEGLQSLEAGAHSFTLPSEPRNAAATPGQNVGEIRLTWNQPSDIGGKGATLSAYRIYRAAAPAEQLTPLTDVPGSTTSYTDRHLKNGTTYTYRISAVNNLGEGPGSNTTSSRPKADIATAPTALFLSPDPSWSGQDRRATFAYTVANSECALDTACPIEHEWRIVLGGSPNGPDGTLLASGSNTHTGHAETTTYNVAVDVTPIAPDGVHVVKALVNTRAGSSQWWPASRAIRIGVPQPDTACLAIADYYTYLAPGVAWPNETALNYTKAFKYKLNGTTSTTPVKFQDGCFPRSAGKGDGVYEIGYGGVLLDATAAAIGTTVQAIDASGTPVTFVIGTDMNVNGIVGDSPTDCFLGPFVSQGTITCAPDADGKYAVLILPSAQNVWGRVRTCVAGTPTKPCTDPYYDQPTAGRVNPPFQADADRDSLGDAWQDVANADAEGLVLVGTTLDDQEFDSPCSVDCAAREATGDAAANLLEYRWQTTPIGPLSSCAPDCRMLHANAMDFDADGWQDGEEIAYWNEPSNDALLDAADWLKFAVAPLDTDAGPFFGDALAARAGDHDRDGVLDGTEVHDLATFPEFADSDCSPIATTCSGPTASRLDPHEGQPGTGDGIADGPELAYWNAISPSARMTDHDQDGLANNLMDPDADGDGLLDGAELSLALAGTCAQACTSAASPDTDEDALLDGATLTLPRASALATSLLQRGVYHDDTATTLTFYGERSLATNPATPDVNVLGRLIGTPPGAPGNVTATQGALRGSVELSWNEPADHGGLSIQAYRIYSGLTADALTLRLTTTATSHVDAGLLGNTTYYYRIAAFNGASEGVLSELLVARTSSTISLPPSVNVSLIPDTRNVLITWLPPVHTGGEPVGAYQILRGPTELAVGVLAQTSGDTFQFIDESVPAGFPFYYQVRAVTSVGEGLASYGVTIIAGATSFERWGNNVLNREPNTPEDDPSFMWFDRPDRVGRTNRVYFDAFLVPQSLGSQATPITGDFGASYYMYAFFGNWVDCNGDGYIGDMLSGRLEYSSTELLEDSLCPSAPHNRDGTVREMIWINPNGGASSREISDTAALVWADFGTPNSAYDPDANFIFPMPYGTTSSVGSILRFADNLTGHTLDYGLAYTGLDVSLPEETLNQTEAWRATRYVKTIWDAEQDPDSPPAMPYAYDPYENNCEGQNVAVTDPTKGPPPLDEAEWPSFMSAIRKTNMTARDCVQALAQDLVMQLCTPSSTCSAWNTRVPVLDERVYMPLERTSEAKNAPNLVLRYQSAGDPDTEADANGLWLPSNNSLDPTRSQNAAACQTGGCNGWYSTGFLVAAPHARFLNQYGFTPGVTPFSQPKISAYAHAGSTYSHAGGLSNAGGSGFYGGSCAPGWECSAADWECPPVGACIQIGQAYEFLDVDDVKYASFPTLIEYDDNHDGVGDAWNASWGTATMPLDVFDDKLDDDGANLLVEFRYLTNPFIWDTDGDGWRDGDELNYWSDNSSEAPPVERDDLDPLLNDVTANPGDPRAQRLIATAQNAAAIAAGIALHPASSMIDVDNDGLVSQRDTDSDGDGLDDFYEWQTLGSYPEFPDSDCAVVTDPGVTPLCSKVKDYGYNSTNRRGDPGTGDLLPDAEEKAFWEGLGKSPSDDCDLDGIINILDPDSDNDGLLDGQEKELNGDPCRGDSDGDGLLDGQEIAILTSPTNPDSDGDGMDDGWEHANRPATDPTDGTDKHEDGDNDTASNIEEYAGNTYGGSNPNLNDTDRDGILDGPELLVYVSNASWWDTDLDGMHDFWEVNHTLDPTDPADADLDPDNDGVDLDADGIPDLAWTNLNEYRYPNELAWNDQTMGRRMTSTNPRNPDSNGNGVNDGTEAYLNSEDYDHDGLPNTIEARDGTNYTAADTDRDGLCDGGRAAECQYPDGTGTNAPGETIDYGSVPTDPDSDHDGLSDGYEAQHFGIIGAAPPPDVDGDGANSLMDVDSDADGLTDADEENVYNTDVLAADTDADHLTDYEELVEYRWSDVAPDPLSNDTDGDGLDDDVELLVAFTNPNNPDSDWDGLTDRQEFDLGTSSVSDDTDRDRMPDAWEVAHGLDPIVDDSAADLDRDSIVLGLTNLEEYHRGTYPNATDTDKDGVNDLAEVLIGLDPRADDRKLNSDTDSLLNFQEYLLGTQPSDPDTDHDGLNDDVEAGTLDNTSLQVGLVATDPTLPDTDQDGLRDGDELAYWNSIGPNAWTTDYDDDNPLPVFRNNLRDLDSDGDMLGDGQELMLLHTLPYSSDTDNDTDSDYDEIMTLGTNPHDPASNRSSLGPISGAGNDTDGDGLSDYAETNVYFTDPNAAHSDTDAINDGQEVIAWAGDWNNNYDSDAIANNLRDWDSDNDGLSDGVEFASAGLDSRKFEFTSPRHADTDGEGLLDGEEETNGITGDAAAAARDSGTPLGTAYTAYHAALGWEGVDDLGRYVKGAFGVRIYDTMADSSVPVSGAPPQQKAAPKGRTFIPDTDNDGVDDNTEHDWGTAINDPDSDKDTLTDYFEGGNDADGDGLINALDTDSDADLINDTIEADRKAAEPLDPYDGDTDDDGLCDGAEFLGPRGRASANNPDYDLDGAPDGLEERVPAPGCVIVEGTTTGGTSTRNWTSSTVSLLTFPGRTTFKAFEGLDHTVPTRDGRTPISVDDFDVDGILDGLEDVDADGVLDADETDPADTDSDDDGLTDGAELRFVGGKKVLAIYLLDYAKEGLPISSAVKYDAANALETNPRNANTDGDTAEDGTVLDDSADIHPKANALMSLDLKTFHMRDVIDACKPQCWGDNVYYPDLKFEIVVETALGNADFEIGIIDDFPAKDPRALADKLDASKLAWGAADRVYGTKPTIASGGLIAGVMTLDLLDDAAAYQLGGRTTLSEMTLRLYLIDVDTTIGDTDDVIDISEAKDSKQYVGEFDLAKLSGSTATTIFADGLKDKNPNGCCAPNDNFGNENDGTLSLSVLSNLFAEFVQRADPTSPPVPAGPCSGFGGC